MRSLSFRAPTACRPTPRRCGRLLERYRVPTFVFINKRDLPGADRAVRLRELRARFGDGCVDFGPDVPAAARAEALAMASER